MYIVYVRDTKIDKKFVYRASSPYLLEKFLKKIHYSKRYKLLYYECMF